MCQSRAAIAARLRVYANQLLKLIHCTLTIDENIKDATGRTGLHIRQALFAEEARLWWDDARGVGQGSSLVLSSVLFHSILDRSAPLSTNAIKSLRKSPMDLDVYAWLAHRLVSPVETEHGHLAAALRAVRPRLLRAALLPPFLHASLEASAEVYPEAKLKVTDAGVILMPSRPHSHRTRRSTSGESEGETHSMRLPAVLRRSRDMGPPSWSRLSDICQLPCTFARRSRQSLVVFRYETLLHQALVGGAGQGSLRGSRYICPALSVRNSRATLRNCRPEYAAFASRPEAGRRRGRYICHACSPNQLFYIRHSDEREREGARAPRALHLSRQTVASLPPRRCICHAKALHLSREVPFSLVKSSTSRPLLYSPVVPVVILGSKAAPSHETRKPNPEPEAMRGGAPRRSTTNQSATAALPIQSPRFTIL